MANPVKKTIQLPLATASREIGDIVRYTQILNSVLLGEFADHAQRLNSMLAKDGTEPMMAPLVQQSVLIANLPAANLWEGGTIYIPNESGGKTLAWSDGTSWRRVRDNVVVS